MTTTASATTLLLARFQFAMVVFFHFLFVPMSIGLGLFVAIAETKYYRSGDPKDAALTKFLAKVFTATFLIGVATGITMEFSFGTNWANYARFVGDIFGAPLAAEALFAFFLESVFLGIVLFGRKKVGRGVYLLSTWLVWIGSVLSALWIIIADSWMQTPAGYDISTTANGAVKATITNFWAAAFNPSTLPRYLHTVDALLILGSFIIMAIGAYYLIKGKKPGSKHAQMAEGDQIFFGRKLLKVGCIVGIITVVLMLPLGDIQSKEVIANQPTKMDAMEGHFTDGPLGVSLIGAGNENASLQLPSFLSSILTGAGAAKSYPGLDTLNKGTVDLSQYKSSGITYTNGVEPTKGQQPSAANGNQTIPAQQPSSNYNNNGSANAATQAGISSSSSANATPSDSLNAGFTYQVYHLMILMWVLMILWLIFALVVLNRKKSFEGGKVKKYLLIFGPLLPFIAIQTGWMTAEVGRQPWVVYNQMLTSQGVSQSVNEIQLVITIILFVIFYVILFIAWLRVTTRLIKKGPQLESAEELAIIGGKKGRAAQAAAAAAAQSAKAGE
ncbi:MAG: cytochrome ubiquinol oxidase subunit I [Coriobacteriales bacterium]|jgi:cytochrome d ubiquinol oxidase subunit I|nr:cytochrome ubiquinol oxidase subunit I [Coriobacteriales bacterium]